MARWIAILGTAALIALVVAAPAQALKVSRLMAPPSACAHQYDAEAPIAAQERAMRCMTNFARRHHRRARFGSLVKLGRSAEDKSGDILRCDSFSHFACGRQFTYWMQRVGYLPARCWRAAENIAWGVGASGSVRSIFRAWMHSSGHRENILSRSYDQFGVGLDVGRLDGRAKVHVWTQEFGSHCGHPRPHAESAPPQRGLGQKVALTG